MAISGCTTYNFVVTSDGLIGLVPNVMRFITDANWALATGDVKAAHDFLEHLWRQTRALVNEHTELHWDPHRYSNDPANQAAYWTKLCPWVTTTGPENLLALQKKMDEFFIDDWEHVFFPDGRAAGNEQLPMLLRVACWQQRLMKKWLAEFGESVQVLDGLNPTRKGTNQFERKPFLGAPAIMVLYQDLE